MEQNGYCSFAYSALACIRTGIRQTCGGSAMANGVSHREPQDDNDEVPFLTRRTALYGATEGEPVSLNDDVRRQHQQVRAGLRESGTCGTSEDRGRHGCQYYEEYQVMPESVGSESLAMAR